MKIRVLMVAGFVGLSSLVGNADEIILKSGKKIECTVLKYTKGKLKLLTESGKVRKGKISAVKTIKFEGGRRNKFLQNEEESSNEDADNDSGIQFGNAALSGKDLQAYKVAYKEVRERLRDIRGQTAYQQETVAKLGKTEDIEGEIKQVEWESPRPSPDREHMQKTKTGDWLFCLRCTLNWNEEIEYEYMDGHYDDHETADRWWEVKVEYVADHFNVLNTELKVNRPF